ncbi:formylglycine-generating enzyme required for sulfatase activity [Sphingomonas zeicaulis]|uniref:formylglycine-generating enzyme family protein n=1 Tax=Sphingomonas zeicaulis TaxID=1632740 RepID=UPI003D1C3F3B
MIRRPAALAAVFLLTGMGSDGGPLEGASGNGCPTLADDQVWVPGGPAQFGSDHSYPEEAPRYAAAVKGFWIDRHEVTNRQYAAFVTATGHVTQAEREGGSVVFAPPGAGALPVAPSQWWRYVQGANWRHPEGPESDLAGRGALPVVHIAFDDARAYAAWKGRALPSEEQFEFAARAGGEESPDQPAPRKANTWQGRFPAENHAADGHRGLAPVGCYDANALGINDMIGNAWEWTQSWYLPGHGATPEVGGPNPSFDPAQPGVRARVIKGGSFLCAPNYCARYRPAARHAQAELAGASHLGFRTVARAVR